MGLLLFLVLLSLARVCPELALLSRSGKAAEAAKWPQRHQQRASGGLVLMAETECEDSGSQLLRAARGGRLSAPLAAGRHMARRVRGASEQKGA